MDWTRLFLLPCARRDWSGSGPAAAILLFVTLGPATASFAADSCTDSKRFLVGSGIYDITGPAAELGMMGYAQPEQKTSGIHQRLRSRAFVIASPCSGKRVAFVSADLGMVFQAVKQAVVRRLRGRYGSLYSDTNVLLSGTHTHSGPGGFSHYALYNLSVLGFDSQNFEGIVNGIYQSIVRAHDGLREGSVRLSKGDLVGAGINRSRSAYDRNPDRGLFPNATDTTMTLVRLDAADGSKVGTINWFGVHGTSMGNDNLLISGDNKGLASYLFEKAMRTDYASPRTFVAAFAQGPEGDVSPNVFGGTNGGGANDDESTWISAKKQLDKAVSLYKEGGKALVGGVDARHSFVKMDSVAVDRTLTREAPRTTCPAAIGISMAAGAEDGPSGYVAEGLRCADLARTWRGAILCPPTRTPCQGEKPIMLETWRTGGPMGRYPWTPEVLPLQILRIGSLAIVAVPFEATTMSAHRLLDTIRAELQPDGVSHLVLAGLSNAYAGYVTTREEYAAQHYEGASTHFGPWTLAAYQQEFRRLAVALRQRRPAAPGPTPRDLSCCQITLQTGVVFDDKPLTESFGSVFRDARPSYRRGETVRVTFWGGHPKNNLRTQGTYLQVQRRNGTAWITVANDWDWETKYIWKRNACVPTLACSHVTIEWAIPSGATAGTYRIRHYGDWKSGWNGRITGYTGTSREFTVS